MRPGFSGFLSPPATPGGPVVSLPTPARDIGTARGTRLESMHVRTSFRSWPPRAAGVDETARLG